jgi:hypothetical protein
MFDVHFTLRMSDGEEHSQDSQVEKEATNLIQKEKEVVNGPDKKEEEEGSQCVDTGSEHIPPPPEESQYERVVTASVEDDIETNNVVEGESVDVETAGQDLQFEE